MCSGQLHLSCWWNSISTRRFCKQKPEIPQQHFVSVTLIFFYWHWSLFPTRLNHFYVHKMPAFATCTMRRCSKLCAHNRSTVSRRELTSICQNCHNKSSVITEIWWPDVWFHAHTAFMQCMVVVAKSEYEEI